MTDYNKIRSMSDEQLEMFLQSLKKRNVNVCMKCNKPTKMVVKIENKTSIQTKSLCGLCENCYTDLLEYLGTYDLGWDR